MKNSENTNTKKELEAISDKIKNSRLKIQDIVVPAAVAFVLIILSVFVFIPMIKATMQFRTEYEEVRGKLKTLDSLESKLNKLEDATLQVDLLNAKSVIPKTLKVSMFVYYIDSLAKENNLASKSISAGDVSVTIGKKGDSDTKKSYLGVSGPLSYTGSLQNILTFLDTLYSRSPYIVSADNISFKKSSDTWRLDLNLIGYYIPESTTDASFYGMFTEYTNYQDILSIFSKKAEVLK
ncbi:hypothetical protein GYA44_01455 [Candidatus Microgenomates bacterium]|nr:hypothetical protein [Candidatus Microgenomates bacterium]